MRLIVGADMLNDLCGMNSVLLRSLSRSTGYNSVLCGLSIPVLVSFPGFLDRLRHEATLAQLQVRVRSRYQRLVS